MREFLYENEKAIMKLENQYLEEADDTKIDSIADLMLVEYLLSYRLLSGKKINLILLNTVKNKAKGILILSKADKIFFEKLEGRSKDFLYFQEYMNKAEHNETFLSAWNEWLRAA